jgi:hypothetical protein
MAAALIRTTAQNGTAPWSRSPSLRSEQTPHPLPQRAGLVSQREREEDGGVSSGAKPLGAEECAFKIFALHVMLGEGRVPRSDSLGWLDECSAFSPAVLKPKPHSHYVASRPFGPQPPSIEVEHFSLPLSRHLPRAEQAKHRS